MCESCNDDFMNDVECAPENVNAQGCFDHLDECFSDFDDDYDSINFNSSVSDSDSDSWEPITEKPSIGVQLANWAIDNNITHFALSSLLSILKPYHAGLPRDPRTLLRTPQTYNIKDIVGTQRQIGQYCHFGIASGIIDLLSSVSDYVDNMLTLQFNFDGLPLFKSASSEFWPILCLVKLIDACPFVVGLYCGAKKPPSIDDYMHDFVTELCSLLDSGIIYNDNHYPVQIDCFVCDAPARSFIKNIKYHNGYHGCDKCTQEGVYVNKKMTFPDTKAKLRNDYDFKSMADEDHHRGPTPLTALPDFGLVTGFVFDYMHLVCLGVVRKLLKFWISGYVHTSVGIASRLPAHSVQIISNRLLNMARFIPQEFARKPRALSEVERWKATEYRQFLLYTGPVVLSGILTENVYNHFMLLFVGITLMMSPLFCKEYVDYANSLLVQFVELASVLYGCDFLVYNVHGLTHLAEDVKRHESLDCFSAFPFENHLKMLKRLVRKSSNPLAQCIRRLSEQRSFAAYKKCPVGDVGFLPTVEHNCRPIVDGFENSVRYMQLKCSKFKINIKRSPSDCCVAIRDKGPVLVVNVLVQDGYLYILCRPFKVLKDLFINPLPSSSIGIHRFQDYRKVTLLFQCVTLCQNVCVFHVGMLTSHVKITHLSMQ